MRQKQMRPEKNDAETESGRMPEKLGLSFGSGLQKKEMCRRWVCFQLFFSGPNLMAPN